MKWDDDVIYDGIFRNRYSRATYVVRLAPKYAGKYAPLVRVNRDVIFARGEKPFFD